MAQWCINNDVTTIELDDMSDRYRQPRNVYVNNGFRYCANDGPEMHATPAAVLQRHADVTTLASNP